jgi:hypothetical protein
VTTTRHTRRIHPYLPPALHDRLVRHCTATGSTESGVITEALRQYLDGTGDRTLLYRRFDRITRSQERLARDLEILSQTFALFVRLWLAHTPRLPKEARSSATASAEARYREFLDAVAARFASGKRFLDDLPQDQLTDPVALDSAARGAPDPVTSCPPDDGAERSPT